MRGLKIQQNDYSNTSLPQINKLEKGAANRHTEQKVLLPVQRPAIDNNDFLPEVNLI